GPGILTGGSHGRHHATSQDCPGCRRRNLLHHLPTQPSLAVRMASENRSLISFTVWSTIVHAGIMAAQATYDGHEIGHLVGDVPALLLVAAVLWYLSPQRQLRVASA